MWSISKGGNQETDHCHCHYGAEDALAPRGAHVKAPRGTGLEGRRQLRTADAREDSLIHSVTVGSLHGFARSSKD